MLASQIAVQIKIAAFCGRNLEDLFDKTNKTISNNPRYRKTHKIFTFRRIHVTKRFELKSCSVKHVLALVQGL